MQAAKVVTTRLRWFYILLTAAPLIFSAPLFVGWCETNYDARIAFLAGAALLTYLIAMTAAILTISSNARKSAARTDLWRPVKNG